MASEFPGRPRLLKGALVAYQSQFLGPIPNVIVFQYNPEQLSRTLTHRAARSDSGDIGGSQEDVLRVQGPPRETISLSVELDACDQLDEPDLHPHVAEFGLHPALAALELLLYPDSAQFLHNRTLADAGTAQICPADVPLVLFVWGRSRVVPVWLTNFSVTEQAFDARLNPIQAKVEFGMQVLSYLELKQATLAYNAYVATQVQKEALARLNLISGAQQVMGMLPV
jgi:hypothetical protein